MLWLTWRQFRAQAIVAAGALAVVAISLIITAFKVRDRFNSAGIPACHVHHDCLRVASFYIFQLRNDTAYDLSFNLGVLFLYAVPALIGLFWGAPLIAREFETGTFRLVWNQSVGRGKWLAIKLGVVGLATMATVGLFSWLITWWADPIDKALALAGQTAPVGEYRIDPLVFGARGIAPIGYAALALALGVTFGVLIRRTLPAMAATLVAFVVVQVAWVNLVRPHLISPKTASTLLKPTHITQFLISGPSRAVTVVGNWRPPGGWVLSNQTVTPAGHPFTGPATSACLSGSPQRCNAWLASKHLRQLITYQPSSRFWTFQWYETGIFLLAAVALTIFCVQRIRHRRLA
ncbi:MAG TPA: ABC transporter permease subunit [Streptosporangiaceae bacterium]|nr:ABC transporter permease subunit [Streptosporangiaceae bacterium]